MNDRDIVERLRADYESAKALGLSRPRFSTEEVGALFAEITRLRDELALCCELKREYQERAAPGASPPAALAVPDGMVLVPVEPTPGLLMSMAIRYDHGLGVPGYYDTLFRFSPSGATHAPTHAQRLESALTTMRQLHEEVVGQGFYSPKREADYAAASSQPASAPDDRRPYSARTRKDALRYRWLRSEDGTGRVTEFWKRACLDEALTLECLDRAVDAEMAAASPQAPADTQPQGREGRG